MIQHSCAKLLILRCENVTPESEKYWSNWEVSGTYTESAAKTETKYHVKYYDYVIAENHWGFYNKCL